MRGSTSPTNRGPSVSQKQHIILVSLWGASALRVFQGALASEREVKLYFFCSQRDVGKNKREMMTPRSKRDLLKNTIKYMISYSQAHASSLAMENYLTPRLYN